MLSRFKQLGLSLIAAGAVSLLSLVPAAAQGAYPNSSGPRYGMSSAPRSQPQPRYGYGSGSGSGSSYGSASGSGNGYGSSSRPGYGYGASSGYGYGSNAYSSPYASRYYTIVRGDTLLKIAQRFGVSLQALLAANPGIRNPNLIYATQRLAIPAYGSGAYGSMGGYKAPGYTAQYGSSGAYQAPGKGYAAPGGSSGAYQAPGGQAGGGNAYATPAAPASNAAAPQATPAPNSTPSAPSQTVTLNLTAHGMAFDQSTLTVPAGAHVVVNFNNMDAMPHNFAVYTDSSAQQAIFQGQIVNGPNSTTYEFDAPGQPGTYFFRCDVHPTIMMGQFIVQ